MGPLTQWLCSWVGPCHSLSRLQGLQVGMLVNNVARVFQLRGGRGSGGLRHWSALVCILWDIELYMHMCVIVHTWYIVLQATASNRLPFSCAIQRDPHSVSPPGLSCPAVHSSEKQRSAERDICSVRECPNYSWPFNHSGFGLRGICGVSHKYASATLVNGSFIIIVLYSVPPNYHNSNSVQSNSSWSL